MAKTKTVVLYQIKDGNKNLFKSFDQKKFNMFDYEIVYECERPMNYAPDDAYNEFRRKKPADYIGRDLSTSDVIGIGDYMYYCNSNGWVRLKEEYYV